MLYSSIDHDILKTGHAWACHPNCVADRVVIVAVDSYPGGTAVNVVVELATESENPQRILAPIAWDSLEPDLGAIVATDIDVSQHLVDYMEWKRIANEGHAGIWTCSIDTIVKTIASANVGS